MICRRRRAGAWLTCQAGGSSGEEGAAPSWGRGFTGTGPPRTVPGRCVACLPVVVPGFGVRGGAGEEGEREAGDEHGHAGGNPARQAGPGRFAEQADAHGRAGHRGDRGDDRQCSWSGRPGRRSASAGRYPFRTRPVRRGSTRRPALAGRRWRRGRTPWSPPPSRNPPAPPPRPGRPRTGVPPHAGPRRPRPARRPRLGRRPGPPLRRSPDGQPRDRDQARSVPGTRRGRDDRQRRTPAGPP